MKKFYKKGIAFLLSFVLILSGIGAGNLVYAGENNTQALLTECKFTSNNNNVPAGITISPEFDPEHFEYSVTVKPPLRTAAVGSGIAFDIASNCEDAEIKASYRNGSTTAIAKKGQIKVKCLNSETTSNTVSITVTPPDGSNLQPSTYTFNVKLGDEDRLIGIKYGDNNTITALSTVLNPMNCTVNALDNYYNYNLDVAESKGTISFDLFTADNKVEVYVNNQQLTGKFPNPKYSYEYRTPTYNLQYGVNTFTIQTKCKGIEESGKTYIFTVNRARPLLTCGFSVEDGGIIRNSLVSEGFNNTIDGYTYAAAGDDKTFRLKVNSAEDCIVTYDIPATRENAGTYEEKIIGKDGLELNRPTYERNGSKDYYDRPKMSPTTAKIYVTKKDETGGDIYDEYTVNIYARMPDGASSVVGAQSAPGQFVNGSYGGGIIVDSTLLADINTDNLYNIHSLGTFGGSITYKFDNPIANNPNNKYGVDFVVYGNSFGKSAEEAASVSVSKDGKTWYNLAGSEHYELSTDWNYSVTYKKGAENGISTRLDSFESTSGAQKWLTFRSDMYWPMNSLHEVIGGGKLSDTYTLSGVCTYDGKGEKPKHAFGYVDVSPNRDVDPTAVTVENPYVSGAQYMDLSWAVDSNGKPVQLDEVNYVKVTNCVLYFTEAFGESSTEVGGITKVNASVMDSAVGVTEIPTSIKINGIEYKDAYFTTSGNGQQKYLDVNLNDETVVTLNVEVNGASKDNIWINNQRSVGKAQRTMILDPDASNLGKRMVRIIVQNGEKEPLIYVFNFTGGGNSASNADLEKLTIAPGDISWVGTDLSEGKVTYEVENNVEKITLAAETLNPGSSMILKSTSDSTGIDLKNSVISELLLLNVGENKFFIDVTSADKNTVKQYEINVVRKDSQIVDNNNIKVYFTFTGDKLHSCDAAGNPLPGHTVQTWVPRTEVMVPKGSTVKYVTDMMLYNAGIDFIVDGGTYISQVFSPTENKWLGEFDNGANSGWMYRHNGLIADVGYAARVLSNGDEVLWFYTDDYKKETGYEGSWLDILSPTEEAKEVTTSGSSGSAITTAPTEVTVSGTTATASVKKENVEAVLKQAKENKSTEIVLNVAASDTKGAETVKIQLDTATVKSIVADTSASITVKTENGQVSLDREALTTVASEAKGTTITLEVVTVSKPTETQQKAAGTNGQVLQLTVKSGDKIISDFNKGKATVTVEIPSKLKDKKVAAIHIAEDGKIEQMSGKTVKIDGKDYYTFGTPHFSAFALVDADELGLEVNDEEESIERIKELVSDMSLKARSSKTSKKNIKVTLTVDKSTAAAIKEIKDMGYTVKYKYYRSTKKASKYQAKVTKTTRSFTNTAGKKGTKYYYKARIQVYDKDGNLVAQTALKQCKYAARTWTK